MENGLFNSENFMPHGHCFFYQPTILWLHITADLLIATAYYSLPIALIYFARKRPDMPFRHMFVMFGLFIFLCGTTHLFGIWVLWNPDYGPEGLVKAATALVSIATAIAAWVIMPQLLKLPSPKQLQLINEELTITKAAVEEKVIQRTAELEAANLELLRTSEEADRANRAKSDFLANMSHEIRTPMNAVVGLTNILAKTNLDEKQQKYISTLQLSAESLLELINDLLDISKIESEQITLEQNDFSLAILLDEVRTMLSVRAREKGLNLNLICDPALTPAILGDVTRMRQIVMNLVSNAIKFTEQGSVIIRAAREQDEQGEWRIILRVTDTGIGVPVEKLNEIFDKFSQADSSITRKYGGSGLGLAITKRLVELMGGTISVKNIIPHGACFSVNLPYRPGITGVSWASSNSETSGDSATSARRILLVEDYAPNILVAATLIEQLGYHCDVAKNGREALERFDEHHYDLILMDIQMPVMDGYTATRLMREREREAGKLPTPIIGVTAHVQVDDRERCYEAGITDFLAKPFTDIELTKRIREYLS